MKRPTVASLKKVTQENLAALGAARLAEILISAAGTRPELKRRLRMELAAEQGADHLAAEIDKRLQSLGASRSKVSWRQRPTFVRDLDVLRALISERHARLDQAGALDRLWLLMDLARKLGVRVRDRDGELGAVFVRTVGDIGGLILQVNDGSSVEALVSAVVKNPVGWSDWMPGLLETMTRDLAKTALRLMLDRQSDAPGLAPIIRQVADAAGDIEAYQATFSPEALKSPPMAAMVAQRLLAAGQIEAAGRQLEASRLRPGKGKAPAPDFDWETQWIDYLDQSGRGEAAQTARWSAFERTLSVARAKAFTSRLTDFNDVEAGGRAFEIAASHPDAMKGLQFLMDWPALPEAARMIEARADEVRVTGEQAELWAARLRTRQPTAAHLLLRKAAAAAFQRRDFATCDRLTQEADAIPTD